MTRTMRIPALIPLLAIAIAVFAQTAAGQTKDERAIRSAGAAWQRYIAAQQVDSIVSIFTPDARRPNSTSRARLLRRSTGATASRTIRRTAKFATRARTSPYGARPTASGGWRWTLQSVVCRRLRPDVSWPLIGCLLAAD